uniref:RNase III domain-containing protein n=1 Tax=Panagrellus redivivus TaxID=6233 RepID=A0A7E4ZWE2_PANRE
MEPFYEGLAENTRLEYIGDSVGLTFLKRYSESHDCFPTLRLANYAVLDQLAHANINTLEVPGSMAGWNKRLCRVVNVEVIEKSRAFHNPLHRDDKIKLNYCPATLKRVEFHAPILNDLVPKMINLTFSAVDELIFHYIIGMHVNGGELKGLNWLTRCINIIWASILNHSGTVIARTRPRMRSKATAAEFEALCRESASCGQQYANQSANGYGGPTVEEVD